MLPDNILLIREDPAKALKQLLDAISWSKVIILVDENTREYCYPLVRKGLPGSHALVEIKSGEEEKNIDTCQYIWEQMTRHKLDRSSLMINLGGGVIGDMGGFCASTYKRGIRFVNIPTTLLAMVDASLGGKLGIDFQGLKNHIGVFKSPEKVAIHAGFLRTLPFREIKSGYAEVIKHALIADGENFDKIVERGAINDMDWEAIIIHSIKIKDKVVEADPIEKGLRKILNYGHTVGHAIESHFLDDRENRLLHGEAIAQGMICEAYLSGKKTGLDRESLERIGKYIIDLYQPALIPQEEIEAIASLVVQDKKNLGNTIRGALLERIGSCLYDIEISREEIIESMIYYNSLIH
jgi:3-dehydroquinate synthase